ncbi:MAG: EF-P beta-lysylation protein EpmB [Pirellulales bacterium]
MPAATLASDTPATPPTGSGWQRELADAIRDPAELCAVLGLDPAVAEEAGAAAGDFPLLVPRSFAARMRPGDPRDPLLLQVLPRAAEREAAAGYSADPLGESEARMAPGVVRKYAGRVLLMLTGGCAVNCRYCFRREFPYAASGATRRGVEQGLAAIAADDSIEEVILSGGDPLVVDDAFLAEVVRQLDGIAHLRRLRIHTRLPVVLPSRVTQGLVDVLRASRLARVIVLHANHPAELDAEVAAAVRRLAAAGAVVLNQAVLLAGVNDSAATLRALSARLVELGVVPYYLHMLDRVAGAAHFDVPEPRALALHRDLRDSLPGYAVPRLAREVPGEPAKAWIA